MFGSKKNDTAQSTAPSTQVKSGPGYSFVGDCECGVSTRPVSSSETARVRIDNHVARDHVAKGQ